MSRIMWVSGCGALLIYVLIVIAPSASSQQAEKRSAQDLLADRDEANKLIERLVKAKDEAKQAVDDFQGAIPAGTVIAYAGPCTRPKDIPAGWLLCDGTVYDGSSAKYERLYSNIGTLWGTTEMPKHASAGDEPEKPAKPFRVPDLRGRFLRGVSLDSNNDPDANDRRDLNDKPVGNVVGSYQRDQVGPHVHNLDQKPHSHNFPIHDGDHNEVGAADGDNRVDGHPATSAVLIDIKVQSNGTSESRPKNAAVNYLIKL